MGPLVPHALGPSRALSKLSSRETGKGGQFFLNPFHATPVLPLAHFVIRSAVIEVLDGWMAQSQQSRWLRLRMCPLGRWMATAMVMAMSQGAKLMEICLRLQ